MTPKTQAKIEEYEEGIQAAEAELEELYGAMERYPSHEDYEVLVGNINDQVATLRYLRKKLEFLKEAE